MRLIEMGDMNLLREVEKDLLVVIREKSANLCW